MDVKVVESGPCRHTLTITISPEDIRAQVDAAFSQASEQAQLKGFRAGRVPRKVIEKRFGEAIRAETKEKLINESFRDACSREDLLVVGRPEIEGIDDSPLKENESIEFTAHVDVRPKIEVKEVKGIEVDSQDTEVTAEDLDNALKQLADQKRTLKPIDEPAGAEDFVKLDMIFFTEGDDEIHRREGVQLNTAIPILGIDQEEYSAKLVGLAAGAEVEMPMTFPDNFEKEEVRNQEGKVKLVAHEVLRVQPAPIDDQLAKDYDFESLDKLREELQARIGEEKVNGEKSRQEEAVLTSILTEHPFPLPASLIEDQVNHQLAGFERKMREGTKMEDEEIKQKLDEARPEAEQQAENQVRRYFMLEAISLKEKIYITEGDIDSALQEIAAQHNAPIEAVREHYEAEDRLGDLRAGLLDRKVREFLRENAKITDKKG